MIGGIAADRGGGEGGVTVTACRFRGGGGLPRGGRGRATRAARGGRDRYAQPLTAHEKALLEAFVEEAGRRWPDEQGWKNISWLPESKNAPYRVRSSVRGSGRRCMIGHFEDLREAASCLLVHDRTCPLDHATRSLGFRRPGVAWDAEGALLPNAVHFDPGSSILNSISSNALLMLAVESVENNCSEPAGPTDLADTALPIWEVLQAGEVGEPKEARLSEPPPTSELFRLGSPLQEPLLLASSARQSYVNTGQATTQPLDLTLPTLQSDGPERLSPWLLSTGPGEGAPPLLDALLDDQEAGMRTPSMFSYPGGDKAGGLALLANASGWGDGFGYEGNGGLGLSDGVPFMSPFSLQLRSPTSPPVSPRGGGEPSWSPPQSATHGESLLVPAGARGGGTPLLDVTFTPPAAPPQAEVEHQLQLEVEYEVQIGDELVHLVMAQGAVVGDLLALLRGMGHMVVHLMAPPATHHEPHNRLLSTLPSGVWSAVGEASRVRGAGPEPEAGDWCLPVRGLVLLQEQLETWILSAPCDDIAIPPDPSNPGWSKATFQRRDLPMLLTTGPEAAVTNFIALRVGTGSLALQRIRQPLECAIADPLKTAHAAVDYLLRAAVDQRLGSAPWEMADEDTALVAVGAELLDTFAAAYKRVQEARRLQLSASALRECLSTAQKGLREDLRLGRSLVPGSSGDGLRRLAYPQPSELKAAAGLMSAILLTTEETVRGPEFLSSGLADAIWHLSTRKQGELLAGVQEVLEELRDHSTFTLESEQARERVLQASNQARQLAAAMDIGGAALAAAWRMGPHGFYNVRCRLVSAASIGYEALGFDLPSLKPNWRGPNDLGEVMQLDLQDALSRDCSTRALRPPLWRGLQAPAVKLPTPPPRVKAPDSPMGVETGDGLRGAEERGDSEAGSSPLLHANGGDATLALLAGSFAREKLGDDPEEHQVFKRAMWAERMESILQGQALPLSTVVSLSGGISAGKTTALTAVSEHLYSIASEAPNEAHAAYRAFVENTQVVKEPLDLWESHGLLGSFYTGEAPACLFQSTAAATIHEVQNAALLRMARGNAGEGVLLQERGGFDTEHVFTETCVPSATERRFLRVINDSLESTLPLHFLVFIWLDVPIDELMRRCQQRARPSEKPLTSAYFEALDARYGQAHRECGRPVYSVDGTLPPIRVAAMVWHLARYAAHAAHALEPIWGGTDQHGRHKVLGFQTAPRGSEVEPLRLRRLASTDLEAMQVSSIGWGDSSMGAVGSLNATQGPTHSGQPNAPKPLVDPATWYGSEPPPVEPGPLNPFLLTENNLLHCGVAFGRSTEAQRLGNVQLMKGYIQASGRMVVNSLSHTSRESYWVLTRQTENALQWDYGCAKRDPAECKGTERPVTLERVIDFARVLLTEAELCCALRSNAAFAEGVLSGAPPPPAPAPVLSALPCAEDPQVQSAGRPPDGAGPPSPPASPPPPEEDDQPDSQSVTEYPSTETYPSTEVSGEAAAAAEVAPMLEEPAQVEEAAVAHRFAAWEATSDRQELTIRPATELAQLATRLYLEGNHTVPNLFTADRVLRAWYARRGVDARITSFIARETENDRVRARSAAVARAQDILTIVLEGYGMDATKFVLTQSLLRVGPLRTVVASGNQPTHQVPIWSVGSDGRVLSEGGLPTGFTGIEGKQVQIVSGTGRFAPVIRMCARVADSSTAGSDAVRLDRGEHFFFGRGGMQVMVIPERVLLVTLEDHAGETCAALWLLVEPDQRDRWPDRWLGEPQSTRSYTKVSMLRLVVDLRYRWSAIGRKRDIKRELFMTALSWLIYRHQFCQRQRLELTPASAECIDLHSSMWWRLFTSAQQNLQRGTVYGLELTDWALDESAKYLGAPSNSKARRPCLLLPPEPPEVQPSGADASLQADPTWLPLSRCAGSHPPLCSRSVGPKLRASPESLKPYASPNSPNYSPNYSPTSSSGSPVPQTTDGAGQSSGHQWHEHPVERADSDPARERLPTPSRSVVRRRVVEVEEESSDEAASETEPALPFAPTTNEQLEEPAQPTVHQGDGVEATLGTTGSSQTLDPSLPLGVLGGPPLGRWKMDRRALDLRGVIALPLQETATHGLSADLRPTPAQRPSGREEASARAPSPRSRSPPPRRSDVPSFYSGERDKQEQEHEMSEQAVTAGAEAKRNCREPQQGLGPDSEYWCPRGWCESESAGPASWLQLSGSVAALRRARAVRLQLAGHSSDAASRTQRSQEVVRTIRKAARLRGEVKSPSPSVPSHTEAGGSDPPQPDGSRDSPAAYHEMVLTDQEMQYVAAYENPPSRLEPTPQPLITRSATEPDGPPSSVRGGAP